MHYQYTVMADSCDINKFFDRLLDFFIKKKRL